MPKQKSPTKPRAEETLLDFIASEEFRGDDPRAAAVKLGFKPKKPTEFERALESRDYLAAARCFRADDQEIPPWLKDMIVEAALAKPKMGRPVDFRQRLVCYFAVRHLMIDQGKKQTEAEELAGAALHLSRQAVHQHYISLRNKYAPKK